MSEQHTYECTVLFDASSSVTVQAASPEEAAAMAEDECSGNQRLCHQCSKTLDTGDSYGVVVYQGDELVAETTDTAVQIAKLRAQRDELMEALQSVAAWMDKQADGQSKGGHATFDLMALREQRDIAQAAIAKHGPSE